MKDLDHIKLYTGENQDILKRPPSFLVKAGTYLICFTLTGIFVLSHYILLPDKALTELTIKKDQVNYLTAAFDAVVHYGEKEKFLRKGEILARYGKEGDADSAFAKEAVSEEAENSAIVSPEDGYLLETSRPAVSFVNKGDTLFGIVPIAESRIEASFVVPSQYKKDLQSGVGNLITLEGENRRYSFKIVKITKMRKDRIEVRIQADSNLVKYFYPAEEGGYVLSAEILVNQQSLWDRLVAAVWTKGG